MTFLVCHVWSRKYKGELQEVKHNVLIGEDSKVQGLYYSIQEMLVLGKQRHNMCLRQWCGFRLLRNRRDMDGGWEGWSLPKRGNQTSGTVNENKY